MSARVLVVQHEAICPPGRLRQWLAAAGVEVEVIHPYAGESVPERLGHDGLVVLGGTMGADDDDQHPWLGPTKRLLAAAVRAAAPTLGVCLGHQLLAVACGGRVRANPRGPTIGLRRVDLAVGAATGGAGDPLLGALPAGASAIHWNDDVVTDPPPRAVVVATTTDGSPQVIRLGMRAWGVQFHPEADVGIATVWADRTVAAGELSQADADARLAEIVQADAALVTTWRPLAERFAGLLLS